MSEISGRERNVDATAVLAKIDDVIEDVDWHIYDGLLVTHSVPADQKIYLVLQGELRHVPNLRTFNNLFKSPTVSINDYLVDRCPRGTALSDGAVIVIAGALNQFIITDGVKMLIPDPATRDKFQLRIDPVIVPDIMLEFIPKGPDIG
ncbi:hypothetical protein Bsp3421_003044 [Burkholderia sp. FERM BP-3421]|jgi:hypothetical protein|uniref:hypothetical protein n=1 Tax=Burkholderia sp. FERM BP-3421 TaxID=1494466 RepID=UPI002361BE35|nr:hypothetical protein [Burkholderia sp. FERM BP-3421]WDD92999.1 hypothetical protein Bsp3421_003044 [Burkholderia sp. FERM BP-3421]